ncbi:tRNA dihydrouridine(20/20a) synthase DusA [Allohahella sp. A8]|uniref:tRNA dihydrouridine(20/20a) synthase DusA n=1 Tax=Allohahella sp. A8 TaxID=3141461 RepID=UPI003A804BDE|tara:strand:+ start:60283 stop:61251 length:969 start_codon:yes stop_codon:yes gene_type:complete
MMDWTDRHYRYFARLLNREVVLYTEMVTTGALIHGDTDRFLAYDPSEHPLVLQLGGSNPEELAQCARMAQQRGYDAVNLNVGCPSDRVQNNMIGACLMAHPQLVRDCLNAMREAVDIPVTIKHRIGIDDQDGEDSLHHFVDTVSGSGCSTFVVHARKALLQGLSPKQNREVPPLIYERVYRLKAAFPELDIIINGGIDSTQASLEHLQHVDGVMIGRAAYQTPWLLAELPGGLAHDVSEGPTDIERRLQVARQFLDYVEREHAEGTRVWAMLRHILGLFHAQKGGRVFRRVLSTEAVRPGTSPAVFARAIDTVEALQYNEAS